MDHFDTHPEHPANQPERKALPSFDQLLENLNSFESAVVDFEADPFSREVTVSFDFSESTLTFIDLTKSIWFDDGKNSVYFTDWTEDISEEVCKAIIQTFDYKFSNSNGSTFLQLR